MSPVAVVLVLFAGAVSTALIAAVGWFCWRLLKTVEMLSATVAAEAKEQSEFAERVTALSAAVNLLSAGSSKLYLSIVESTEATKRFEGRINEHVAAVTTLISAVGSAGAVEAQSVRAELHAHGEAMRGLLAVSPMFTNIANSLDELDKGIKTFLTVVVNMQVPGAMPADIVKGTPLGAGEAYPYDEAMMAEQERIRRKARGEADPDNPEVRQPEIEIV